jgi:hypothetical protein
MRRSRKEKGDQIKRNKLRTKGRLRSDKGETKDKDTRNTEVFDGDGEVRKNKQTLFSIKKRIGS